MKINISILSVLAVSLVLLSCGNKSADSTTIEGEMTVQQENPLGEEQVDVLELNGNERWMVNEEMKPYISKSEEILKDYIASDLSDYELLAQQLNEEIRGLIKSCTMEGKSHEELHKWLHPYMEKINQLSKSQDQAKTSALVSELQQSFQTYHQYFQ